MSSFETTPTLPTAPDSSPEQKHFHEFFNSLSLQFRTQADALHATGLLEHIPVSDEHAIAFEIAEGITGMDGKHYKLPTPEEVKQHFSQEQYKEKILQGFTKLLIVPFAYPLATIRTRYEQTLLKHHKAGKLLDKDGNKLDLDTNQPLFVANEFNRADETGNLIYYPTQFDKINHGGKTKQQLLNDPHQPFPGFHILLIKPDMTIPRQGKARPPQAGRTDIETNQTPIQYLKTIQTNSNHKQEQGLTIEDSLILAITHLEATNQVIDDSQNYTDSVNWNIANYDSVSGDVPYSGWSRGSRQAYVYGYGPGVALGSSGCRVAVG